MTIVVAAGLCSAIRPKLLTALPPARHPNVRIAAWGEGHWHVPCPDSQVFPDADIWVKKHIAHIDVTGDITYAKLVEYLICRLIAAEQGTMYLMSKPLEPRNQLWAAKWHTLPDPGEWRQVGCKHTPPQTQTKPPARRRRPARKRTNARRRGQDGGILDVVARWWR